MYSCQKSSRRPQSWITEELHHLTYEKRRLYKRARSSQVESAWKRNKVWRSQKGHTVTLLLTFPGRKIIENLAGHFVRAKHNNSHLTGSFLLNGEQINDSLGIATEFNHFFPLQLFSASDMSNIVTTPNTRPLPTPRFSYQKSRKSPPIRCMDLME